MEKINVKGGIDTKEKGESEKLPKLLSNERQNGSKTQLNLMSRIFNRGLLLTDMDL
jgi:hypothetical protein